MSFLDWFTVIVAVLIVPLGVLSIVTWESVVEWAAKLSIEGRRNERRRQRLGASLLSDGKQFLLRRFEKETKKRKGKVSGDWRNRYLKES